MKDVRRNDFHDDWETHAGANLGGLARRLRDSFLGDGDAVGVAHKLALGCRQTTATIRFDLLENLADRILGIRHRPSS